MTLTPLQHENFVPPADGHDISGQAILPGLHSTTGVLPKSLPGYSLGIDARVIATTAELAAEFPFNQDMGGGNVLGIGWVQSSIGGGVRSSSATTYLAGAITRPNLDVLINAHVAKVLPIGFQNGKPSFRLVQFSSGPHCTSTSVRFNSEIADPSPQHSLTSLLHPMR